MITKKPFELRWSDENMQFTVVTYLEYSGLQHDPNCLF